ncbi:MAG: prepilin peptidase [Candidatus Binataceae bacterium]
MLEIPLWLGAAAAFMMGACIGSFVNVAAYRIPRELSVVAPRSFCPQCRRQLPNWANVPILAYIFLRGRCHMCGAAIPFRYFLTELALATAALYLYLGFPFSDGFARFILCATLYAVALIDFDWRVIPNLLTLGAIPVGILLASLAMPEIGWMNSLIGIVVGAGFLFITGEVYTLIRKAEGVGLGDVYLMGMTGAFLGWAGVLFTLFVGSLFGSVGGVAFALSGGAPGPPEEEIPAAIAEVTGRTSGSLEAARPAGLLRTEVPFGPFLALAAAIFALFQPQLTHWYLAH